MKNENKHLSRIILVVSIVISCSMFLSACGSTVEKIDADMSKVSADI